MKTKKDTYIMELNVKQIETVKVLFDTYKTETVTRAQINALVKKKRFLIHRG